jgi:hypothetical protein
MFDYTHIPPNPMTNLTRQIREHWVTHLPRMTAHLRATGQFDALVEAAAAQTQDAVITYTSENSKGRNSAEVFFEAWELFREEWAFLPAEADTAEANTPLEANTREVLAFLQAKAADLATEDNDDIDADLNEDKEINDGDET